MPLTLCPFNDLKTGFVLTCTRLGVNGMRETFIFSIIFKLFCPDKWLAGDPVAITILSA